MSNSKQIKEAPVPFDKLRKIGITKQDFDAMPEKLKDTLLSGHVTPLMSLRVPTENGKAVQIPMRLQFVFDKDDKLQLLTYQIHREVDNRLRLNNAEMQRVRDGEVVMKEIREDNQRKQRYVQLDKETNSLMYRDVATVKLEKKLAEMEKVKDISLGSSQKEAAVLGKPVELVIGDEKVSVGVDIREPQGFKVIKGDMEEWKRQQAIRYDDLHEGYMGYVQTDENRWEFKQVVDKLAYKEEQSVSEKRKNEKKTSMKM